jgi:hypothetical protein
MRLQVFIGSLCGLVMGVITIIIWILAFEPHGGIELSPYLFPLSAPILNRFYPGQSIPVPIFYGLPFLQWVLAGMLVDFLRGILSKRGRK